MAQPILRELPVGAPIADPLIVLDIESRGGDTPHTIVTFGNATGRLQSAPFWPSDLYKIAGLSRGDVAQVIGTVGAYRERRQLVVDSIRIVPREQLDWRSLMPTAGDVGRYWNAVQLWRAGIRAPRLAAILALFFDDHHFRERYQECPASISGHHALLGGLLKHTCEVVHIALAIARLYPSADLDLVLVGGLLHDIGKLESYRWNGWFELTLLGAVIGHVVLGALLLDRGVRAVSPMPCSEQELLLLQHLILAHHGKPEFGAPVAPMTLEAEIIHFADNSSAKATSMNDALQSRDNFPNDLEVSARSLWQLDHRRAWRGRSTWGRDLHGTGTLTPPRLVSGACKKRNSRRAQGPGGRLSHCYPVWMAIRTGSIMRALRVGSSRGPIPHTAPRGAESGRVKHATGFTCLSRCDHQDR